MNGTAIGRQIGEIRRVVFLVLALAGVALWGLNGYVSAAQADGGYSNRSAVSFVLVNNASEFRLIRTDLIVASGVATRQ